MKKTDWDQYYERPYRTAHLSRSITAGNLLNYMKMGMRDYPVEFPVITEIGGANSCFFEAIYDSLKPKKYQIIDSNEQGLRKFSQRIRPDRLSRTTLINNDVLKINEITSLVEQQADCQLSDIVFSVGLVEHFSPKDTALAIKSHFHLAKPGGLVIISAPTPTFLYKVARYLAEMAGAWIFHDERPLAVSELVSEMELSGEILDRKIIWPIVFTQAMVAARKAKQ